MKLLNGIDGIWHGLKLTAPFLIGPEIKNMRYVVLEIQSFPAS
jgi:hypothetical protein